MKASSNLFVRFSLATVLGVIFYFVANHRSESANAAPKLHLQETAITKDTKSATSFAPVIKKAAPSVVNIYTTKVVKQRQMMSPFEMDPFFRRFFGDDAEGQRDGRTQTRKEQSLGSGVIVSDDGYILTASHVVDGADEVKVALANDHQEFNAKVVGNDPQTDIAVIKVDAKSLPAITVTDSDKLEVGDRVLAIGNPFGVGQTVTSGIISATGRGGFGIVDYEDFLQTDASINPGNSGGALVDAEGRLVGINTAILSRSGGSQGVGFAVPVNLARNIMDRLITDGKITRGYLGVMIQPVTPDLAKEFKLGDRTGALVGEVTAKSPAASAGLKEGDVIIEFNGKKVRDSRNLRLMVSQTAPKTTANVKLIRDGKEKSLSVTLGELPSEKLMSSRGRSERDLGAKGEALDGVEVTDLNTRWRRQFNLPSGIHGALVTDVDPESAAASAGLRQGDVILEINRRPVKSADDAIDLSRDAKGGRVLLRVYSQGGSRYVIIGPQQSRR